MLKPLLQLFVLWLLALVTGCATTSSYVAQTSADRKLLGSAGYELKQLESQIAKAEKDFAAIK